MSDCTTVSCRNPWTCEHARERAEGASFQLGQRWYLTRRGETLHLGLPVGTTEHGGVLEIVAMNAAEGWVKFGPPVDR